MFYDTLTKALEAILANVEETANPLIEWLHLEAIATYETIPGSVECINWHFFCLLK